MGQIRTVLKQRAGLKTTATHSRDPSPLQKLKERSQRMIRRSLKTQLKNLFNGLTPTSLQRSKRHLRQLLCQFFNPWLVQPVELQEVCREQEVCQTLEEQHQEVLHLLKTQHLDQLLKKSIKRFELFSIDYNITVFEIL